MSLAKDIQRHLALKPPPLLSGAMKVGISVGAEAFETWRPDIIIVGNVIAGEANCEAQDLGSSVISEVENMLERGQLGC